MEAPEHPIGIYTPKPMLNAADRIKVIDEIAALPAYLRSLLAGMPVTFLDEKYRSWTVRQIVHHLADSHCHAFLRFKLALTEAAPKIKPYVEGAWVQLPDSLNADPELSLKLLDAIHARWTVLLRAMSDSDFENVYIHPEYEQTFTLTEALGLYLWHGRHHSGQIAWLKSHRA